MGMVDGLQGSLGLTCAMCLSCTALLCPALPYQPASLPACRRRGMRANVGIPSILNNVDQ